MNKEKFTSQRVFLLEEALLSRYLKSHDVSLIWRSLPDGTISTIPVKFLLLSIFNSACVLLIMYCVQVIHFM